MHLCVSWLQNAPTVVCKMVHLWEMLRDIYEFTKALSMMENLRHYFHKGFSFAWNEMDIGSFASTCSSRRQHMRRWWCGEVTLVFWYRKVHRKAGWRGRLRYTDSKMWVDLNWMNLLRCDCLEWVKKIKWIGELICKSFGETALLLRRVRIKGKYIVVCSVVYMYG